MKIIYDAMGGDNAPESVVKGAALAKEKFEIEPILVGKETEILNIISENNFNSDDFEIVDCDEKITNDEEPVMALRKKKNSSLVVGLSMLKEKKADGFISAGSTGAVLAGGIFIVKRLEGVERAPIAVILPTKNKNTLLLDAGANVDTTPEMLSGFAYMGYIYIKNVMKIENPTVGLLNIGKEAQKGNKLYKETYNLLNDDGRINFVGNIEAREVPFGAVDVLVADGFDGNIFLKTYEGSLGMLLSLIKEELKNSQNMELIDGFKDIFKNISGKLDYRKVGGAPLLGLNEPIVKAHGDTDEYGILGATEQLIEYIKSNAVEKMKNNL